MNINLFSVSLICKQRRQSIYTHTVQPEYVQHININKAPHDKQVPGMNQNRLIKELLKLRNFEIRIVLSHCHFQIALFKPEPDLSTGLGVA